MRRCPKRSRGSSTSLRATESSEPEPKRKALLYLDLRFQKLLATAESDWDKTEAAAEPIVCRLKNFIETDESVEEEEEAAVDDLGGIHELAAEAACAACSSAEEKSRSQGHSMPSHLRQTCSN